MLRRKGTQGQSGAANSGWAKNHNDKFLIVTESQIIRHWAWLV